MNISTGGPHILLFERDQQLAALLGSELQLAGFECHAARTAVEAFDIIARYPVRLVLVNLAQAAAARREFWVALDTQRRGRGFQVFTFRCTNIAGYGPPADEADDRPYAVPVDMEVDGMLGIMNMVNTIRSRMAMANIGATSRASSNIGAQATVPLASVTPDSPSPSTGVPSPTAPRRTSPTPVPPSSPAQAPRAPASQSPDRIRAVIYPNQRVWTAAREGNEGEESGSGEAPLPNEPGLAQLSRMLQEHQEHRTPLLEELAHGNATQSAATGERTSSLQSAQAAGSTRASSTPLRASPIQDLPPEYDRGEQPDQRSHATTTPGEQASPYYAQQSTSSPLMSIATPSPTPQTTQASTASTPARQNLFPSRDEEDITAHSAAVPSAFHARTTTSPTQQAEAAYRAGQPGPQAYRGSASSASGHKEPAVIEKVQPVAPASTTTTAGRKQDIADHAIIQDIVQSLPSMPPPSPQPQVLNGRATRSLGSVLLEGQLVPQNRLEVAQNIQRMLRSVDMNYQLGEILLMFKLLTPDQLLAASLVSHGLLTTTQISALGRIRQELHSIGLEYDLENLLILFRILTPEQLREVRASWSA